MLYFGKRNEVKYLFIYTLYLYRNCIILSNIYGLSQKMAPVGGRLEGVEFGWLCPWGRGTACSIFCLL